MVEVEVEEEVSEEEEVELELEEEEEQLPPGWVVKGLKKGAGKSKAARGKVVWYENKVTGAITMKRPR